MVSTLIPALFFALFTIIGGVKMYTNFFYLKKHHPGFMKKEKLLDIDFSNLQYHPLKQLRFQFRYVYPMVFSNKFALDEHLKRSIRNTRILFLLAVVSIAIAIIVS